VTLGDADLAEAELLAAIGSGCPVCPLVLETERAVVFWLDRANVREAATSDRIVAARGLCGRHWSMLLRRARGDLGVAGARLGARLAERLELDLDEREPGPPSRCPVCASVRRREASTLAILASLLRDPATEAAYRASDGLCRPHARLALDEPLEPGVATAIADTHRRALRRASARLHEAATDREARVDALERAVALFVGRSPTAGT
jgi:hypothetical protein